MNVKDILSAAKIKVVNKHPYVIAVLLSLRPFPVPGLGTIGVDAGWRLAYDPEIVEKWGTGADGSGHHGVAAVLAHEVWHVLKEHFKRQQGRDPQRWNISGDREINDDLVKAGWKFPSTPMLPEQIGMADGLTAEEYYEKEPKQNDPGKGGKSAVPGCGGKCGGCAGNPHEHEDKQKADSCEGGKDAPKFIPVTEQQILRRTVAQEVQKASRLAGNVPAGLRAWAEQELAPPTIDWRKQLAALVRNAVADKAGASDYSYKRPSRRQWGMRHVFGRAPILPSLRSPVPVVKGVLDVSGSMSGSPDAAARSEIIGVCKAVGAPVEWVSCDTQVAARAKVSGKRDIAKLGDTGGGTDLRVGIADLDRSRPDVIIVISDGYTAWNEPGTIRARLIAAITPGGEKPPEHIPSVMIEE
jgi:predicted metal-dependent peptidase